MVDNLNNEVWFDQARGKYTINDASSGLYICHKQNYAQIY